jgi:hypothetical protein
MKSIALSTDVFAKIWSLLLIHRFHTPKYYKMDVGIVTHFTARD